MKKKVKARRSRPRPHRSDARAMIPEPSPEEIQNRFREELLAQITHGGRLCAEMESQFGKNPAPELETLIKLYRVLILKFSLEARVSPGMFKLVTDLTKPVMEWARLQEKRRERELAEQKYRDQVETQKAAEAKEEKVESGQGALSPDTLEKIQRELKLF